MKKTSFYCNIAFSFYRNIACENHTGIFFRQALDQLLSFQVFVDLTQVNIVSFLKQLSSVEKISYLFLLDNLGKGSSINDVTDKKRANDLMRIVLEI